MAFTLTDDQVDTLSKYGVEEGGYLPNTSKRLAPDGTFVGGKTDYNPTYSSPAPTDFTSQASPTGLNTVPTIDSTLNAGGNVQNTGDLTYGSDDPYIQEMHRLGAQSKAEAEAEADPNQLYRDQLRQYQKEIDAVNDIYRQQLNVANQEGRGRLGSATASQARGGLLGSDFGQAQTENVRGYNTDIRGGIEAERLARVQVILGTVRKSAADELANKVKAKQAGAESYREYLSNASSRRTDNIRAIAQAMHDQGLTPDEVGNMEEILEGSTANEDDVRLAYTEYAKQAEAANAEAQSKADKAERELVIKEEKNRIDEAYNTGRLAISEYNARIAEINANKNTSGSNSGIDDNTIAKIHSAFAEDRDWKNPDTGIVEGFVNTENYLDFAKEWESEGGSITDFLKEFPIETHINPNDPTSTTMIQNLISNEEKAVEVPDWVRPG